MDILVNISVLYYNISEYWGQQTLVFYFYPMYNVPYYSFYTCNVLGLNLVLFIQKSAKFQMIIVNGAMEKRKLMSKLSTLLATLFYPLWFLLTLGSTRRAELGILDFHKMFGFEFKKCSFLVHLTTLMCRINVHACLFPAKFVP